MIEPRRPRIRRTMTALVLASMLAAACSSGASDSTTTQPPADDADGPATPATSDTTDGEETGSTEVSTDDSVVADDTVTTQASDDVTASTPPTPALDDGDPAPSLDEVCKALAEGGFESRVDAVSRFLADGDGDGGRSELESACGDDLARLDAAREIRAAANALDDRPDPVSITGLRCANGDYSFIAENTSEVDIGVHVAFRIFANDDEVPTSSANYPIVIWRLAPGDRQGITGDFDEPDAESYRCNLSARVFVADTTDAGAGNPDSVDPDRTGDDPTEWIGALLEAETLAVGSGDIDAAADTEDLRSVFYDDVFDSTQGSQLATRIPTSIRICSATVDQPGPDRMSFVYYITYSDGDASESFFRHGLFRRGADGHWRWLSAAHYFQSDDFADCAS